MLCIFRKTNRVFFIIYNLINVLNGKTYKQVSESYSLSIIVRALWLQHLKKQFLIFQLFLSFQ